MRYRWTQLAKFNGWRKISSVPLFALMSKTPNVLFRFRFLLEKRFQFGKLVSVDQIDF